MFHHHMLAYLNWFLEWPLLIFVVATGIICTIALHFIQIKDLPKAFSESLTPKKPSRPRQDSGGQASKALADKEKTSGEISPMQAFINTVNASIGNGSIAGMGVAIYLGGAGAAFWVVIFGLLMMSLRFLEVYVATAISTKKVSKNNLGGPMLYLQELPGGKYIAFLYAFFCFLFGLCGGNAIQANSIQVSLEKTFHAAPMVVAGILFIFVLYIVLGGAKRISVASSLLVPLKVGLFLFSIFGVILYHWRAIPHTLWFICQSAFFPEAVQGGLFGVTLIHALQWGMNSAIFATESGLGTAAIMFGYTGSTNPKESAYMGMLSAFITTIICFLVGFSIVLSGVFKNGSTSTALTITAYETVFGNYAGIMVTILSILFCIGVLVSYAYIARATWNALTNSRGSFLFSLIYSGCTALGVLANVSPLWFLTTAINGTLLLINIGGLLYLLPRYRREILAK